MSSIVATLSSLDVKAMGVMLASAVLMDATIVRTVLLPTSMKPLGDRTSCWYLPSRLEGLPQVPAPAVHPEPELDPSRLSVDVAREEALVSLALRGELDLETAPQFREHLSDVEEDTMTLLVDLRNVTSPDPCGIGELVGAHQRTRHDGRRLVVVRSEGTRIHRLLRVAGLDIAA